jgi:hypothetical protein
MPIRRRFNRLALGPIVGHTDEKSSLIWIQVRDDPSAYQLRVSGVGLFPFDPTEANAQEFRTAVATANGLRPDWRYRYSVLRRGRVVPQASGNFRTMPLPGAMANILFCAISCSKVEKPGAWQAFESFVERAKPHFVLMMGDQVYVDEDGVDIFKDHFFDVFQNRVESSSPPRRKALVTKYQISWSRPEVRRVMSNVPCYMMWDDHEIRDGWGSLASDSPTLVERYPRGTDIFKKSNAYFDDTRDVYWHFQACHSPLFNNDPPLHGTRVAMPYAFRCGRLVVLMLDSRGERDVFRKEFPILGTSQWNFLEATVEQLGEDVDVVVVMTPTPIATLDPEGQTLKIMGNRTDDVDAFKQGDHKELFRPYSTEEFKDFVLADIGSRLSRLSGTPVNLGNFKISNIDEARDQWSQVTSQPEQLRLLRLAGHARRVNRTGPPREILFVSGDIHAGCIFDLHVSKPEYTAISITSSGISTVENRLLSVGVLVDKDFKVADGIRSTLREFVRGFNYGVIQVLVDPAGAQIMPSLAHEGNSFTVGLDISDLL